MVPPFDPQAFTHDDALTLLEGLASHRPVVVRATKGRTHINYCGHSASGATLYEAVQQLDALILSSPGKEPGPGPKLAIYPECG